MATNKVVTDDLTGIRDSIEKLEIEMQYLKLEIRNIVTYLTLSGGS